MQLRYIENTEKDAKTYGMQFWDYPKQDGLLPEDRMFIGYRANKIIFTETAVLYETKSTAVG